MKESVDVKRKLKKMLFCRFSIQAVKLNNPLMGTETHDWAPFLPPVAVLLN